MRISFEEPTLRAFSTVDILLMNSKIKFRSKAKVRAGFCFCMSSSRERAGKL